MTDLTIVSWVLVAVAQAYRAWDASYAGQVAEWAGKIGGYYVEEIYRRHIVHWRELGLEAARQEVEDGRGE